MIRILYVDDDPDICEIAEMSLAIDPEIDVRSCQSGFDALEIARVWEPDLILLDYMMPKIDGAGTLHMLRDELPAMPPVAFITARTAERDVADLLSLGAAGVLAKPFDPLTLASQCRTFLDA
jgi:DNA-binding response OmpR family regulator